jgi:hypothetical protein
VSPKKQCGMAGQSAVEMALLLPVLLILFLGSWTASDLIADNNSAVQATRAGARYAAEIGNNNFQTGDGTSPLQVDTDIIDQMLPILNTELTNAVVNEIDIYQPSPCSNGGTFTPGTAGTASGCPPNNGAYTTPELIDKYTISGTTITAGNIPQYTLDLRSQIPYDEAELGVRVLFTYTSPTLRFFNQQDNAYTVVRLGPEE